MTFRICKRQGMHSNISLALTMLLNPRAAQQAHHDSSCIAQSCPNPWRRFESRQRMLRSAVSLQVNAFIVRKGMKGLRTSKIEKNIELRCVQNADIFLDDCFLPDSARLPGVNSFKVPLLADCAEPVQVTPASQDRP